jgi:tRNA-dependent cyclodipeptide synthase
MQIRDYLNINKEDIDQKKTNIFIPICLGNKFFSVDGVLTQNIKDYLDWALENTRDKVLFIVVDRIQDTNFFVRNNSKTEKASIVRVLKEGDILKAAVSDLIESLPDDKKDRVEVIRWEDYQNSDPLWAHITHTVYKEFKNNNDFRDAVLGCVKTSVTDRKFSEENYFRLCDYVLDEFCLAYSGIKYKDLHFGLYVYPVTDSVLDFIEAIKREDVFSKINEKLPKNITGVVIMN